MGTIEEAGRKRRRKRNLKYSLLTAVKLSALAGIMLTAPNTIRVLNKFDLLPRRSNTSAVGRAQRRLIHNGLLSVKNGLFRLTPKGSAQLSVLGSQYTFKKPSRWDGRWRVLAFDVPEYRKSVRDKIRRTLVHIGFIHLQDSVWVYPYDCEDLVVLLKADFKIGKDVLYMIVDELEGDHRLRKHFGFKSSR